MDRLLPDLPAVLIVDDIEANRRLVAAMLAEVECRVQFAETGLEALQSVRRQPPDLVLLDIQMPGMDGIEVCRRIKANSSTRLLPVVMVTALNQTADRIKALEAGADDFMSKPIDRTELVARTRSALRLKAVYDTLDSAERVIFALAAAVEAKDAYTEAHTIRVAESARRLGTEVGLSKELIETLFVGGLIHDIGKIGVPDAILTKPGPLSVGEREVMERHPVIGEGIVRPLRSAVGALPIVRHHHERWDGTGYPDQLAGTAIPLMARILAICDAFDAMVSDRPYRKGRSQQEAVEILVAGRGSQWDPNLVDAFVRGQALRPQTWAV
jgi:putative two-component system response regulator